VLAGGGVGYPLHGCTQKYRGSHARPPEGAEARLPSPRALRLQEGGISVHIPRKAVWTNPLLSAVPNAPRAYGTPRRTQAHYCVTSPSHAHTALPRGDTETTKHPHAASAVARRGVEFGASQQREGLKALGAHLHARLDGGHLDAVAPIHSPTRTPVSHYRTGVVATNVAHAGRCCSTPIVEVVGLSPCLCSAFPTRCRRRAVAVD
jgi:hypothetical protein